jgi:hypothetical protein
MNLPGSAPSGVMVAPIGVIVKAPPLLDLDRPEGVAGKK